ILENNNWLEPLEEPREEPEDPEEEPEDLWEKLDVVLKSEVAESEVVEIFDLQYNESFDFPGTFDTPDPLRSLICRVVLTKASSVSITISGMSQLSANFATDFLKEFITTHKFPKNSGS
ncbi:19865_t:CDS:2, partial [Gigaspora rosea]